MWQRLTVGGTYMIVFDPVALHEDFPNLDLTGRDNWETALSDTFAIGLLLQGQSGAIRSTGRRGVCNRFNSCTDTNSHIYVNPDVYTNRYSNPDTYINPDARATRYSPPHRP